MTDWTPRTPVFVSPKINNVDIVIDTIDEIIDDYGNTNDWTNPGDETTPYESEYGLWIKNYHPWRATNYPWQREVLTTNWTERTKP